MKFTWYFENAKDIAWYPSVGLLLFIALFVFIVRMIYAKKESYYKQQKNIPLDYEK